MAAVSRTASGVGVPGRAARRLARRFGEIFATNSASLA